MTATEPEIELHDEFGPSTLNSLSKCCGFRNRKDQEEGKDKDEDKEEGYLSAGERGTAIHIALQKGDLDRLKDDEDRHQAQKCVDYVEALITERLPKLPDKDYREIRLNIDLGGGLKTFGTADRILVYGDIAILIDFKTGRLAVPDVEQNFQAMAYVLGILQRFAGINTVEVFFLLPRREEISLGTFKREGVPDIKLAINTVIQRAKKADPAQFNPQPNLCEWCARQTSCAALAAKVLPIALREGPGLPVPISNLVDKARPEDIPHLLRLAPLAEAWASGVRQEALRLNLEEGLEIPGYQRLERKLPRAINSVVGAWKLVKADVPLEEFLACTTKVSVPKLEELVAGIAKAGKKGSKKSARQDLENKLRHADLLREEGKIFYLKEKKD